ncbi:MAG TPA: alpha/beta fold hydrolase [Polyangiales bacterium]|nr:alpha/beta fold hydrolase [Polyangiales bacterium]
MKTPVLMVHGMNCTGAVWSQFRSFYEAQGARVYTPTLRPELRVSVSQKPPRELRELSLADYVADLELEVERIVAETGEIPVAIGHSMGGLLVQALAARGRLRAAVFISPAAPGGVRTFRTHLFWNGYLLAKRFGRVPPMIRPELRFLSRVVLNAMPEAERAAAAAAMVHESGRAFADFANFPIDERAIKVPVLTIAAGRDRLIPAPLVRLTARKYAPCGGELREYASHGHWLYAEPGWEIPARDIYDWLLAVTRADSLRPAAYAAASELRPGQ